MSLHNLQVASQLAPPRDGLTSFKLRHRHVSVPACVQGRFPDALFGGLLFLSLTPRAQVRLPRTPGPHGPGQSLGYPVLLPRLGARGQSPWGREGPGVQRLLLGPWLCRDNGCALEPATPSYLQKGKLRPCAVNMAESSLRQARRAASPGANVAGGRWPPTARCLVFSQGKRLHRDRDLFPHDVSHTEQKRLEGRHRHKLAHTTSL